MRSQLLLSTTLRTLKSSPKQTLAFYNLRMAGVPSETAQIQKQANMSTSSTSLSAKAKELDIKSQVNVAQGVTLSDDQKVIVGSVLDVRPLPFLFSLPPPFPLRNKSYEKREKQNSNKT